jgi:hypothetical protein
MKEQSRQLTISIIGMSWYYKDDFEKIKKIFVDGENIGASYHDWLRRAEIGYNHLISKGHLVEKVFISSKYFPKWCKENNLELDSKARARFGSEIVHKKYIEKQQLDALCPIFLLNNFKGSLIQIGTGVLIDISDITFLLTAAHVIDEMKYGDILIPTNAGLKSLEGTFSYLETPNKKTRAKDKLDIGYFKLETNFARSLHNDLNVINIDDIVFLDDATQSVIYTFAGYPSSKTKTRSNFAQSEPYYYSGYSVEKEIYSKYGYNPNFHIIVKFRRHSSVTAIGEKYFPPFPRGISGGGIYVWPEEFQGQLIPTGRKLVGIVHTYKQDEGLLIGTNIQAFIKCIAINNSHLMSTA